MKPITTAPKSKSSTKPAKGLKLRTALKAGDDGTNPGTKLNHNEKLVAR